ncbi:hypothetical protein [Peribacillus deserti]|uniref:Uncharacterized protein n=1 Tax=Peribacillus deserti TaxID=673318 RepID=A0A2N5M2S4_9BACI|nr:hypothetical protein [Peribacillus deserti]PLT28657.1 hypothetical protein CUU66_17310 [Peribacillus deserti]
MKKNLGGLQNTIAVYRAAYAQAIGDVTATINSAQAPCHAGGKPAYLSWASKRLETERNEQRLRRSSFSTFGQLIQIIS